MLVQQLHLNDKSVTVNKTENGNQVTYDLHVAPGAAQSVWNVKSTGNTTADSEAAAKTITDGKTVEMAAGKNLTVKQTSNEDGAKVEYGLAGDLTNIKTIKNEVLLLSQLAATNSNSMAVM